MKKSLLLLLLSAAVASAVEIQYPGSYVSFSSTNINITSSSNLYPGNVWSMQVTNTLKDGFAATYTNGTFYSDGFGWNKANNGSNVYAIFNEGAALANYSVTNICVLLGATNFGIETTWFYSTVWPYTNPATWFDQDDAQTNITVLSFAPGTNILTGSYSFEGTFFRSNGVLYILPEVQVPRFFSATNRGTLTIQMAGDNDGLNIVHENGVDTSSIRVQESSDKLVIGSGRISITPTTAFALIQLGSANALQDSVKFEHEGTTGKSKPALWDASTATVTHYVSAIGKTNGAGAEILEFHNPGIALGDATAAASNRVMTLKTNGLSLVYPLGLEATTNVSVQPTGSDGFLWNSNKMLFWVTPTKTNLVSNGI